MTDDLDRVPGVGTPGEPTNLPRVPASGEPADGAPFDDRRDEPPSGAPWTVGIPQGADPWSVPAAAPSATG